MIAQIVVGDGHHQVFIGDLGIKLTQSVMTTDFSQVRGLEIAQTAGEFRHALLFIVAGIKEHGGRYLLAFFINYPQRLSTGHLKCLARACGNQDFMNTVVTHITITPPLVPENEVTWL